MKRTIIQGYYKILTFEDLYAVEDAMTNEELREMREKIIHIMRNMDIPDISTRALVESVLTKGYLAAHIIPGKQ